jgi:hypothetical protein
MQSLNTTRCHIGDLANAAVEDALVRLSPDYRRDREKSAEMPHDRT